MLPAPRVRPALTMAAMAGLVTASLCVAPNLATASARPGAEQVLYSFAGPNGAGPLNGVVAGPGGVLYGTTVFGGSHGGGCVFALIPKGSGYTERILVSFNGADGAKPGGNIALGSHGDLFGDSDSGGALGGGNVFELVPNGTGYTEKVLHNFAGGTDGAQPIGTPVLDAHGDVFGTTQFGGTGGQGIVYEMKASASGYTEKVLHAFANTGGQPQTGLSIASDGTLFGSLYGFSVVNQDGTIFRLQLRKSGPVYTDLYNFTGHTDGANPIAPLTVDNHTGVLYGTTQYGGLRDNGTVFSLTPSGHGYTERVLSALSSGRDGFGPQAPLLLTASGDLFGTANLGGIRCAGIGCGTVFELTPSGPAYTFGVVYRFTGPPDGAETQYAGVTAGPGGELFGTTRSGGTAHTCYDGGPGGALGCGTVYKVAP